MGLGPEAGSLRWSDEEHNLLVQRTNYQLQLEEEDESMIVSWKEHWEQLSARLAMRGYNRTPGACRNHWKRSTELQRATEQAAGPRWDDSEHRILAHMTAKQLQLEKADPSAIIPWARHWTKVSLQLEEHGYTRSSEACAAYWELIEDNPEHALRLESQINGDNQPWGAIEEEDDGDDSGDTAKQQKQKSTKVYPWTNEEHENLFRLLMARRELEEKSGLERLSGIKLWTHIAQSHQKSGFDRSWEECKTYCSNYGGLQSGFDEGSKTSANAGTESTASNSSTLSSLWSPVNEQRDAIAVSENPALNELRVFQKNRSLEPLPDENPVSATPTTNTNAVDSETSGYESGKLQGISMWANSSFYLPC